MTKSKNTKRALLMSVLSMMLCVAMLVGTTFAWFTDSVSSGNNRIIAGNLDAKLFYKTGAMDDWRDVESLNPDEPRDADPFFRNAAGDIMRWEPGAIGITSFKVVNAGTLAFKYALSLLAVNYNQLDGKDLRDVIKFAVIDGELSQGFTAEEARNLTYSDFYEFTKRSSLPANGEQIYTVVAYWMPNSNDVDNLYNVSNGKIATELNGAPSVPNWLYLDIDIRLNAWQDTVESDSFNNQYDAMADVLDIFPDGCYAVTPHDGWVELDIYTGRSTADINIEYNGYAPDNTDDRMEGWVTNGSGKITPGAANGNTHLIFFKTETANSEDKPSFVLTQDGRVLPPLKVNTDGRIVMNKAVYMSASNAVASAAAVNAVSAPAVTVDLSKAITVSSEEEMMDVLAELNKDGGEKVVKLGGNIDRMDRRSLSLTKGTLTILGEDHSINIKKFANSNFIVTNDAILNLGADNYEKELHIICDTSGHSAPMISVSGNAQMNICKNAVIDGKGYASASGVQITGNATVNLLGGTIENCASHGAQGGINVTESSEFNMWSGEIKNCSSQLAGGAVRLFQEVSAPLPEIPAVFNMYGGTISNCSGRFAGAICVTENSEFNMSGGTIKKCEGAYGGGVYVGATSIFKMSGGKIEDCQGSFVGGVILNESATFNMFDEATIVNCEGGAGGGVLMLTSSKFNMSGGTIESCHGSLGVGVYVQDSSVFNMSGGTIKNCESTGDKVADNCVAGSAAVCMLGNSKNIQSIPQFTMDGGSITGCNANAENAEDNVYGGAIFVGAGTVTLNKGEITGNTLKAGNGKSAYGGGIGSYYMGYATEINIANGFKLYGNIADTAGDDIARQSDSIKLTLGNVNTDVMLSDGYAVDGWYIDEPKNRWGSEDYQYDESKIEVGETTAEFIKAAHGVTTAMKGVGAPGRLLDLYDGEGEIDAISKGGAKTVKWLLKSGDLATYVNASALIKAGTEITMAYTDADSTSVKYYYLIVPADTTSISLGDFTAMGAGAKFVPGTEARDPIYQLSFVFPVDQENINVWMSDTANDATNESEVNIIFTGNSVSVPSGTLGADGYNVTVSGLTGLEADQSDSRHNTNEHLANRRAVLALEAVDAQGRNVAIESDTVVTLGAKQAKVSTGIAAAEITEDGIYTIEVSALPQDAVGIRVSLCYTNNNIIYKPMANVMDFVTVK